MQCQVPTELDRRRYSKVSTIREFEVQVNRGGHKLQELKVGTKGKDQALLQRASS